MLFVSSAAGVRPKSADRGGPLFGVPTPIAGAFRGNVYRLPKGTASLPDFTHLTPAETIYTTRLNYSLQQCDDEWFGIDYQTTFQVREAGKYGFALTADDGAELYIDHKCVISNDGIHAADTIEGSARLDAGTHHMRVPYFQGPRPYVALVLEIETPRRRQRIFDTTDFAPSGAGSAGGEAEWRPTLRRNR